MLEEDRSVILSFLSGGRDSEYAPSSGEVIGILKTMHDEMSAGLKDATEIENHAIKTYDELMAAKTKEVEALSAAIEAKLKLVGELSVALAQMKNDIVDA